MVWGEGTNFAGILYSMPVTIDMLELCVAQQSNFCPKGDSGEAFPQGSILYHGEPTNEDLSRVGVS